MTKTNEGFVYTPTEINIKIGELAAEHNINLHDIDTSAIMTFCTNNAFKSGKIFHRFCDLAIRTAPEKLKAHALE